MEFVNQGPGRPSPKAGYRCKICGKEGGKPDSHWYQLCPYKGKADDKRAFNPPRKGYICKFCHKPGGEVDSHWFQQCPKRFEYEGIQVPHPLKLRAAAANAGMLNLMGTPQTLAAQTAAVAMNLGVIPQLQATTQPNQMDYAQQFTANGVGVFMYPGNSMSNMSNLLSNQPMNQMNQINQLNPNVSQLGQMQQLNQQQVYFLQQQLSSQGSLQQQNSNDSMGTTKQGANHSSNPNFGSFNLKQSAGIDNIIGNQPTKDEVMASTGRSLYEGFPGMEKPTFGMNMNAFEKNPENTGLSEDQKLLSEITKQTQELSFKDGKPSIETDIKTE